MVTLCLSPSRFFFLLSSQDGFGPFSDPSGGTVNNNSDTFTFTSSFSDEDSSFDSFGDFGDFQTAEDHEHDGGVGSLTPTSGSWTFANEVGGSVDSSSINSSSHGGGGGGGASVEPRTSSSSSSLSAR